jgi:tetratricopeptide (TPR) repeat protein
MAAELDRRNAHEPMFAADASPAARGRPARRLTGILFALGLTGAIFLVYQPAWHGEFVWDDDLHLVNNPVLRTGGLAKTWVPGSYLNYWPLTFTVYRLEFQLWRMQPLGFHLVNLMLHAMASLLVWRVLLRLRVPGAMFAAAIFALHPVNVETAAWIAQLKGLLSWTLALAAVLCYLAHEQRGGWWRQLLGLGLFGLSMLAKGIAISLPPVLLALAWWQRGRIERRDLLRALPWFLLAATMAGVEVWTQRLSTMETVVRCDGLASRAAIAGRAVWFYLGELVWPQNLCFAYPRWQVDPGRLWTYFPDALLAGMFALAWWRRRDAWGRVALMLIVGYVGLLLPVLGFANIYFMRYSLVADHWQYAAMAVPCAVFAGGVTALARRARLRRAVQGALCLGLLAVLSVLTWRQCGTYKNKETLYHTAIACNPDCWIAYNNLGYALTFQGRLSEAITYYRKALDIKPDYPEAHANLGGALAIQGNTTEAIQHYRLAMKFDAHSAEAHYNLGNALFGRGQVDEALAEYRLAIDCKPDHPSARFNIATILFGRGQWEAAAAQYRKLLEIKPDYAEAYSNLGALLDRRGEFDVAIENFRKALQLRPDFADAHYNLGHTLAARGRLDEAIEQYRKAVELKPGFADARRNLDLALAQRERSARLLAQRRAAIQERPGDAAPLNDAAWTLATAPDASIRDGAAAIELAGRALALSGKQERPAVMGTLAAAYAEAGRFAEAVRMAQKALELARQDKRQPLVDSLQAEIRLYEAGKPLRELPSPSDQTSARP